MLVGNTASSLRLEEAVGKLVQTPHVVLFPTGWGAGFGAITALVRRHDHVLLDRLAHACLQQGAYAATANVTRFRHLDNETVRRSLQKIRSADAENGVLVVTEGLFSMDADVPVLAELQATCREYGATLLVDVAHDLGALGPGGTGTLGAQGVLGNVDLVVGAFSKTFASNGGFLATHASAVKQYVKTFGGPHTFSNALSPIQTAVVTEAIGIVVSEEGAWLRARLLEAVRAVRETFAREGIACLGTPSAIVPLVVGAEAVGRIASRLLFERGVIVNLVEYPAVPVGPSRWGGPGSGCSSRPLTPRTTWCRRRTRSRGRCARRKRCGRLLIPSHLSRYLSGRSPSPSPRQRLSDALQPTAHLLPLPPPMRTAPLRTLLLGCAGFLALLLAGCDDAAPADPALAGATAVPAAGEVVPGRYVVVLRDAPAARTGGRLAPEARAALDRLQAAPGVRSRLTYTHALVGFSADLTDAAVAALRADPAVRFVEPVVVATAAEAVTQTGATWGIDRIDQRALPLDGAYTYDGTGAGVTVYVVDSGIRTTHTEFGGRAALALNADGTPVDFVGDGQNGADCNGHGTHVAASAGGATYGVAKGVDLVSVRVLNCNGTSFIDTIIAGIDWVTANGTARPAVMNLSLVAGNQASVEIAVQNAVAAGLTVVAAAGNENTDACRRTPARVPEAITVGATTSADRRASYSNHGTCLDLFAPGDAVLSAHWTGDDATNTRNGTSMATAHASGAAARYLEDHPAAPAAEVSDALVAEATTGVVADPKRSPNRLLFVAGAPPPNAPPTAAFAFSCTGLTCAFTDQSTDPDGSVVSWSWDFCDGNTSLEASPSHTYAGAGTYTVTLTVTDDDGATATTQQSVTASEGGSGGLSLTATKRVAGGWAYADLAWSPADGGNVVVTRTGPLPATFTTADDGAHSDKIGRNVSGTFTYRLCEAGTTNCSNEASVTF